MPRSRESGKSFTGLKDKKIKIIKFEKGQSSAGTPTKKCSLLCPPVWANYRSLSGDSYYAAKQQGYMTENVFTVNWRSDIKAGMYVLYRGEAYKIGYVDDMEGYKKDLKLYCETVIDISKEELKDMMNAAVE